MNKNCDDYITEYLMLDKNQRIPFKLSLHLLSCKKCRKTIKALAKAEKISARPLKIKAPVNSQEITQIVSQIDPNYKPKNQKINFINWIVAGIILIASMILANILTKGISASFLSFVVIMIFAFLLIFYFFGFIYSNIEFFVKKIGTKLV